MISRQFLNVIGGICAWSWIFLIPAIAAGIVLQSREAMVGAAIASCLLTTFWDTRFTLKRWTFWRNQITIEFAFFDDEKSESSAPKFTAENPWGDS